MKSKPSRRNRSLQHRNPLEHPHSHPDNALYEDDADPSLFFGSRHPKRKTDRKARQLCSQVADTLSYVLGGECDDDVLRNLLVVAVDPAPDSSQLAVTVRQDPPVGAISPSEVLARLTAASGKLRAAVAAAITRKRAPKLLFCIQPALPGPVLPEEVQP